MKKAIAISIITVLTGAAVASAQGPHGAGKERAEACDGPMGGAHRFEKLDKNGDKVITQDEMLSGMLEHFDKADANKDGTVTADEHKAAFAKFAEERFTADDKNKDGFLAGDELPPHLAKHLAKIDTNQDGKLSKAELTAMPPKHMGRGKERFNHDKPHTRAELTAKVTEHFQKLDQDHDGKLTQEELAQGHHRGPHGHHGHH